MTIGQPTSIHPIYTVFWLSPPHPIPCLIVGVNGMAQLGAVVSVSATSFRIIFNPPHVEFRRESIQQFKETLELLQQCSFRPISPERFGRLCNLLCPPDDKSGSSREPKPSSPSPCSVRELLRSPSLERTLRDGIHPGPAASGELDDGVSAFCVPLHEASNLREADLSAYFNSVRWPNL